ncbi:hypothetical protein GJ744_003479 [Endocarpon pusillum]|uniref:Uncharacterized protein n=1 Tax=Endocarpon pusillum TaxID=364733 RepID=A0A8H7AM95_9EURO|nr:hypothetical protein GJ744_003479 [Endocarpon pusillum]
MAASFEISKFTAEFLRKLVRPCHLPRFQWQAPPRILSRFAAPGRVYADLPGIVGPTQLPMQRREKA